MHARIKLADDTFDVYLAREGAALAVEVDGETHKVDVHSDKDTFTVKVGDRTFKVKLDGAQVVVDGDAYALNVTDVRSAGAPGQHGPKGAGDVKPPMPGKVVAIKVKAGDKVEAGQTLLVLEAMKMQNELSAPGAGTVKDVKVSVGQNVETKDVLIVIE